MIKRKLHALIDELNITEFTVTGDTVTFGYNAVVADQLSLPERMGAVTLTIASDVQLVKEWISDNLHLLGEHPTVLLPPTTKFPCTVTDLLLRRGITVVHDEGDHWTVEVPCHADERPINISLKGYAGLNPFMYDHLLRARTDDVLVSFKWGMQVFDDIHEMNGACIYGRSVAGYDPTSEFLGQHNQVVLTFKKEAP